MVFLLIVLIIFIAWIIIRVITVTQLVYKIKKVSFKEWTQILLVYLKKRSERKLFYSFMLIESSLIGFIPQISNLLIDLKYNHDEFKLYMDLFPNPEWLCIIIAVLIALGYYLYLLLSNKPSLENFQEIIDASHIINDEFNFIPTQKWFENQNVKALKSLGKRFSEERNFPFDDMGYVLTSLRKNGDFMPLLEDKLHDFIDALLSFLKRIKNYEMSEGVVSKCESLSIKINSIDREIIDYNKGMIESVRDCISIINSVFYDLLKSNSESYLLNTISEVSRKGSTLELALSNKWISFSKRNLIMIYGSAGMGKSHLIGDIVTCRMKKNEPSILLLGQHFITMEEPLVQIQKLLDIKCSKEKFLNKLNDYGNQIGIPVVIFIDGINEGAGEALWMNFWENLTAEIEGYDYLRIVISYRTSNRKNWFYDLAHNPNNAVYCHRGFKWHETEASEYMFSSFNLDQPLWPLYGDEFTNPLFLTIYCRNHEFSGRPLEFADFWTTIQEYCKNINHQLSLKFNYNDVNDLVTESLKTLAKLIVTSQDRWNVEYSNVMECLSNVAFYTKNPSEFFEALIDEGLLETYQRDDKAYVSYGFERIGDYFIADYLINNTSSEEWFDYKYGDLSEALTIISPKVKNVELIELVQEDDKDNAIDAFINNSVWRDTFSDKGHQIIDSFEETSNYKSLFEIILSRPYRSDNYANSSKLYELLWDKTMVKRDEIWSTLISQYWDLGKCLMNLAEWSCNATNTSIKALDKQVAYACTETLVWSLSSTWRKLRDMSTHAIVKILTKHTYLIQPLLEKYHNVNDMYIQERLWCAIYGTVMLIQDETVIRNVAEWVYRNIFESKKVSEHILVRDYLKGIVLYGIIHGLEINVDVRIINIPFTNGVIPTILSSDEVMSKYGYETDLQTESELKENNAKRLILKSMTTEYNMKRLYGDFGRYVFQYNIEKIGEDAGLMSNWAIQMIFEDFGYDAKAFAEFDTANASYYRTHSSVERIGKKYQWIAMYRIMAILIDKNADKEIDWVDVISNVRNIDPTLYPGKKIKYQESKYSIPNYDISKVKNDYIWMKQWKDMPRIKEYLVVKDEENIEWVNLFSYNDIEYKPYAHIDNNTNKRSLWTYIQAYIVDKANIKEVCQKLYKYGTEGRSFHENGDIYNVFSREFYWAHIYKKIVKEDYYLNVPFGVADMEFNHITMQPTYLQYILSSDSDMSSDDTFSMLLPNESLYNKLKLNFSEEYGIWNDNNGKIAVIDNYIYSNGHRALLIRKDLLLDYLRKNKKCIFWPVLNERMVQDMESLGAANYEQNGGWAYMNENGKVYQRLRCYELSKLQIINNKLKKLMTTKTDSFLVWLYEHNLIKLSKKKKNKLYKKDDFRLNIMYESPNTSDDIVKKLEELSMIESEENNDNLN